MQANEVFFAIGDFGTLGWPKLFQGGAQVVVCALCAVVVVFLQRLFALAKAFANWIKEPLPVEGKALESAVASWIKEPLPVTLRSFCQLDQGVFASRSQGTSNGC